MWRFILQFCSVWHLPKCSASADGRNSNRIVFVYHLNWMCVRVGIGVFFSEREKPRILGEQIWIGVANEWVTLRMVGHRTDDRYGFYISLYLEIGWFNTRPKTMEYIKKLKMIRCTGDVEVYKGRHLLTNQLVMLKQIKPNALDDGIPASAIR